MENNFMLNCNFDFLNLDNKDIANNKLMLKNLNDLKVYVKNVLTLFEGKIENNAIEFREGLKIQILFKKI